MCPIGQEMLSEQYKRYVNKKQEFSTNVVLNFKLPPEYVVISHLARLKHQYFSSST